ncbi:MAG: hypothetical protein P0Y64_00850 [Candidatus Sphingomonas colombiensis]|nr:hypothetical protein [Sphingomonas sp.]WEK43427.1 MAG: hypothetical protein P0Y64_00850 [Sphingomonas sp.]
MREFQIMVLAGLLTATLMAPAPVRAAKEAQPAPFETVKAGDRSMSCEALAAEINSLDSRQQAGGAKKKKGGMGLLKMLGAASPMLGMAGSTGAVASSAMGAAGSVAGATAPPQPDGGAEDMMLRIQRKQRLMRIFDEKKC